MRIVLIHNPKAGDRKHGKKQLMASLIRSGHQAFYHSIKERGWKKAFKKPVDLIIAAGGDGTVHKTAWQIVDSGIPLAILPLGTANNLARSLGFTRYFLRPQKRAARGPTKSARKNACFTFRLLSEQLRDVCV